MNSVTSFLDASNVYGSHPSDNNILRNTGMPGQMKITRRVNSKDILPEVGGDFRAGDARAREMPGLLSMHTIWMREHNRIGKKRTYHIDAYKPPLLIKPLLLPNSNKAPLLLSKSPLFEDFGHFKEKIAINLHPETLKFL